MSDFLITADASKVSGAEFFAMLFGHPPVSAEEKRAKAEAFWAERRKQDRIELELIRDRLCDLASPALAAKFRAKWAAEDAAAEDRRAA